MRARTALMATGAALMVAGCHTDMWVQPRSTAQHSSTFFADGMASRPPVPGTVARGKAKLDDGYYTGRVNGVLVTKIPVNQAMADLKLKTYKDLILRGKERFEIYCTPCHGQLGDGKGMIAQRGLALRRIPASYHTPRLRSLPDGHLFEVMSQGYGVMYSYASRVETADRWAIASYIRVLQKSQNVPAQTLGGEELAQVGGAN